jgi:hypothetical protein
MRNDESLKDCYFYFEKGSKSDPNLEILHIWKASLTLEIVKQENVKIQLVQQISVSSIFINCVQHIIVSSYLLCQAFNRHLFNFCC